jgi:hypothetical protein
VHGGTELPITPCTNLLASWTSTPNQAFAVPAQDGSYRCARSDCSLYQLMLERRGSAFLRRWQDRC